MGVTLFPQLFFLAVLVLLAVYFPFALEDNAVLNAPLGLWRPEDVDRVTKALGIQPAHRRFVNSASELETAAHGAPLPPTLARHGGTAGLWCW